MTTCAVEPDPCIPNVDGPVLSPSHDEVRVVQSPYEIYFLRLHMFLVGKSILMCRWREVVKGLSK